MIILAADTSTSQGSLALRDRAGTLLREELDSWRTHSETLLPAVEKILTRAGYKREDVQAIAVGTGPGAFTGLRVGLATFKAWAAARGLPVIPVVSLDAPALQVLREGKTVAVLADARKGEVYAAYYPSLDENSLPLRQGDVMLLPHEAIPEWLLSLEDPGMVLTGTGLHLLSEKGLLKGPETVPGVTGAPDAAWILAIAEVLLPMGAAVDPSGLIPGYVRSPDAKKPSPGSMVTIDSGPENFHKKR